MTPRRLIALALAAFMLHLNVVRADAACATHESDASAAGTHAGHDMAAMHAGHDVNAWDSVTDDASCETPVQTGCCEAMTSCAPLVGSDVESRSAAFAPSHETVVSPFATHPRSRATAPEPPPPRL